MRIRWRLAALLSVSVLGVALSVHVPQAFATRNSSGTYSLPSGNPVTSGTPISSSWANTTLSDIATEVTSSLDRSGRGAMLAPLQCSNGTVALPALTFGSDPDTGLYRIGANNPAMAAGGIKSQEWTATGSTFPLTMTVTGVTTLTGATTQTGVLSTATGITATQSTSNGNAITATGNGTGLGGLFTGGTTGCGVYGYAAGGTTIPTTDCGLAGRGSTANNGVGVVGFGGGTGAGVVGVATTGATADTNSRWAVQVGDSGANGHMKLAGGNPTSTVGFSNALTPANVIKAWGYLTTSGINTVTVNAGFNVASAVCGSAGNDSIIVTLATGLSSSNYVVLPVTGNAGITSTVKASISSSTVFTLSNAGISCDTDVGSLVAFAVLGLQ